MYEAEYMRADKELDSILRFMLRADKLKEVERTGCTWCVPGWNQEKGIPRNMAGLTPVVLNIAIVGQFLTWKQCIVSDLGTI